MCKHVSERRRLLSSRHPVRAIDDAQWHALNAVVAGEHYIRLHVGAKLVRLGRFGHLSGVVEAELDGNGDGIGDSADVLAIDEVRLK